MIRSSRIPPLLDRICGDGILSSYLITKDGELLGSSTRKSDYTKSSTSNLNDCAANAPMESAITDVSSSSSSWEEMDPSDIGALVAEVVDDYRRLGLELALLNPISPDNGEKNGNGISTKSDTSNSSDPKRKESNAKDRGRLNCLIVEMEKGLVGIVMATSNIYVVALTDSTAEHGLLKMKLTNLGGYVREQFLSLGE